jgi:Na+-translocating ferredoxin:NAD+ oxidoreductase RnfD subunit
VQFAAGAGHEISAGQRRGTSFGQRLWERTWWIFGFLFLAVYVWAWNRFGGFAVARCFAALFAVLGASFLLYSWRRRRYAMQSV